MSMIDTFSTYPLSYTEFEETEEPINEDKWQNWLEKIADSKNKTQESFSNK